MYVQVIEVKKIRLKREEEQITQNLVEYGKKSGFLSLNEKSLQVVIMTSYKFLKRSSGNCM